jgi:hypothetical protein
MSKSEGLPCDIHEQLDSFPVVGKFKCVDYLSTANSSLQSSKKIIEGYF